MAVDDFEVLTPTEIEASIESEPADVFQAPKRATIRRLCACGCGEEVSGNRALKRGHTVGTGITAAWAPEDMYVISSGLTGMLMASTLWLEKKRGVPRMELEEAQALSNPIGRITARHTPKRLLAYLKPGDVADAFAIAGVLSAYLTRIAISESPRSENATNGQQYNPPVQGYVDLSRYAYNPSQIGQQQNGAFDPNRMQQNG